MTDHSDIYTQECLLDMARHWQRRAADTYMQMEWYRAEDFTAAAALWQLHAASYAALARRALFQALARPV